MVHELLGRRSYLLPGFILLPDSVEQMTAGPSTTWLSISVDRRFIASRVHHERRKGDGRLLFQFWESEKRKAPEKKSGRTRAPAGIALAHALLPEERKSLANLCIVDACCYLKIRRCRLK